MKKTDTEADQGILDDLLVKQQLDYSQARPNRFASSVSPDQITVTLVHDGAAVFTTLAAVNKVFWALITAMPKAGTPKPPRNRPAGR
jgi:hypothetical protein